MDVIELAQHRLGIFMALKEMFQQKMGRGSTLEKALIEELTKCVSQAKTNAIAADVEKFGNNKNDVLIATLAVNIDESVWCKCLDQAAAVAMSATATDHLKNVDVTTMAEGIRDRETWAPGRKEAALKAPHHLFFFSAVDRDGAIRYFDVMKGEQGFSLAESATNAPRLGQCVESVYDVPPGRVLHHVHRNYGEYPTNAARHAMQFFVTTNGLTQLTDIAETHSQLEALPIWAAIFSKLGCPGSSFSFNQSRSFAEVNVDDLCTIELLPEPLPSAFEAIESATLEVFFGLGIVNPFGPTFNFVAALGDWKEGNVMPVVKVMLNPFSQSVEIVAQLKVGARWEPMHDLEPLIQLGFGSCPTLVLLSARVPEILRLPLATKILESFGDEAVARYYGRVSSHFGDPWTRVSEEMEAVTTRMAEEKQGAWWRRLSAMVEATLQRTVGSIPEAEAGRRLAQLVLQPQHVWPEMQALLFAWNGSIHKTGIPEQLAAGAFPDERLKKFLLERVCPSLWIPAEASKETTAQQQWKADLEARAATIKEPERRLPDMADQAIRDAVRKRKGSQP